MNYDRRLVIDTGVLVSAAIRPESVPALALEKALLHFEVCASDETWAELETVLLCAKFDRYATAEVRCAFIAGLRQRVKFIPVNHAVTDCPDPKDNKFLALAESNFYNAVSPSKAEGFWQFLKTTAIQYGLEVNEEVDERYNVAKATEAACQYFFEAYAKYGNWTLVAASFNRGQDGLSDALQNQKARNFYELSLNEETSRYIYRIVALKEIYTHPLKYGLYLMASDFYPVIPTYSILVDTPIHDLPAFAQKNKVSVRVFRDFNPWLRRYTLTNKLKKTYQILLPKEGALNSVFLQKSLPPSETYFHDTLKINEIH